MQKGYVRKLDEIELKESKDDEKQWYVPHHPVKNPHKPEWSDEYATQQLNTSESR